MFSDELELIEKVQIKLHEATQGTDMNDFIQRVVNAIVRQEGMPQEYVNPGNLRAAPWLTHPFINEKNFWVPRSRTEGLAGLAHVFTLHLAQGNTITDFIAGHPGVYAGFAPGADNNKPDIYIKNVCDWACIPATDQPLWNYIL